MLEVADGSQILQVSRPTAQVLMGDGHPFDQQQENSIGEDGQRLVTSEDYEVRIIEPAQPGGNWEAKAAIKMHMTENALTVRIVSIKVCPSITHGWRPSNFIVRYSDL